MRMTISLLLAMLMFCIAGNATAEEYVPSGDLTDTAISSSNFLAKPPSIQMGGPTCTNDPPDMTVSASSEGECLVIAQSYCGYRVASACYSGGSCSFACIGNY